MLFARLKQEIKQLRLLRWLISYVVAAALAMSVLAIFFGNSSYSIDQLAIILATPIIVIITGVRLVQHFSIEPSTDSSAKDVRQDKSNRWFMLVASLVLLVVLGSLTFAITILISAGVYSLLGVDSASNVALHTISLPSFKVAGYSMALLLLMLFGYILYPYRHKVFRAVRDRIKRFKIETKEIRLNGRALRLH